MTFLERINDDLNQALKQRDRTVVGTLRLLSASLKNAAIAERGELSEEAVIAVVQREAKRRKEAITAYTDAGSAERAEQEAAELEVLQRYLPEQLDAAAIDAAVTSAITSSGASGPQDFGRVMGLAMKELKGKADGAAVQEAVKRLLQPS